MSEKGNSLPNKDVMQNYRIGQGVKTIGIVIVNSKFAKELPYLNVKRSALRLLHECSVRGVVFYTVKLWECNVIVNKL